MRRLYAVHCHEFGVDEMSNYIMRKIRNMNEIPVYSDILSDYVVFDVWANIVMIKPSGDEKN